MPGARLITAGSYSSVSASCSNAGGAPSAATLSWQAPRGSQVARAKVSRLLRWCKESALPSGVANLCSCRLLPYHACPSQHTLPPGLASMFNFSHAARVTPNRVCCNALLAAYARAKPPQYQRVSWAPLGKGEVVDWV